jgi:pimeloyl-ACP methyl ester carboxylesterase
MAGAYTGRYRVLIPDLPGWGESSRTEGADYGVAAQVERVVKLLDAWGIDRVHLVGHSMGGHIAGVFAARHPERVLDVVLVAPAGLHFKVTPFAQQILDGGTPFNVDTVPQYEALLHTLFEQPPWLPPRALQVLVDRNIANHAFHAATLDALKRGPDTFLLEASLADLPPLTRLVWCAYDHVLDVSSLEVVRQKRPDIPSEILDACGHMPMMEDPASTARAVERGFVLN